MPQLQENLEGWGCLWLRGGGDSRKSRASGLTVVGLGHMGEAVGIHMSGHQGRRLDYTEIFHRCH